MRLTLKIYKNKGRFQFEVIFIIFRLQSPFNSVGNTFELYFSQDPPFFLLPKF